MINNNRFSWDDDSDRAERLELLSANIDTYAVEIGYDGARLAWAQGADVAWEDARATAIVEKGGMHNAFEDFHKFVDESAIYYSSAKEILLTIIWEHGGKPDDFIELYGLKGESPRRYKKLIAHIDAWLKEDALLRPNNDPRVVPQAILDQLSAKRNQMETLYQASYQEKTESDEAFAAKFELFSDDSYQLTILYNIACMIWGNDAPKLQLLGFCPSSEIWTENKPPHPTNFAYDDVAKKFTWDVVEGVDNYEIDYRLTGASGDWTQLYKGVDTSTQHKPPDPGEYDFRIRSWADDDSGAWSGVIVVNFSGGALVGVPTGFKFDDAKQLFKWDFMEAALLYELEISRDEGQTWVQKYFDVDTYFDAGHLDTGKALARVRALDGYQDPGDWSDPPLEVVFKLRTPDFLAYGQFKNEFICGFVPNAEGYRFELGQVGGTIQVIDIPENHFVRDLGFGDWKARVRAYRGAELSDWAPAIEVHIIFVMPEDFEYNGGAKRIDWDKVAGAKLYQLVNESGTISYIGADKHFDIELTAPEKFRVRAGDDDGNWGEWSAWTMLG